MIFSIKFDKIYFSNHIKKIFRGADIYAWSKIFSQNFVKIYYFFEKIKI